MKVIKLTWTNVVLDAMMMKMSRRRRRRIMMMMMMMNIQHPTAKSQKSAKTKLPIERMESPGLDPLFPVTQEDESYTEKMSRG
ncbi:hypothetical protein PAMP_024817 [Pampus punctatissimus]